MNKKPSIVVVEDDKDILEIIQLILNNDYDLHLFTSPPDNFIDIITTQRPELIIFDWLIPNVVIEDFLEPIRKASPATKILIISAHNNMPQAFTNKKVDALLPKPFGVKRLKAEIEKLVIMNTTSTLK
ncbi:MAG: response regulator [Candidatus Cyclobacteriaceae bacterium M2_1C_046]